MTEKKKAPKAEKAKKKVVPKEKETKEVPVTKKALCIEMISREGGATIEEMAQKCTEAGLGDLERNIKTVKLWVPKLGFKVKKDPETQKWRRA